MTRRKKILILPVLKTCNGDLSKQWYVEYSLRDPRSDKMHRKRIYIPLDKGKDARIKDGNKLVLELTDKLNSGWTPFEDVDKNIFEDQLEYSNVARVYGSTKKENRTVRFCCNEFLTRKKGEINDKSYICYVSKFRVFCQYLDTSKHATKDVTAIDRDIIIAFLQHLATENKLSSRTISKYQQIIYSLFKYLIREKRILRENPVYDIPRLGITKDEAPVPFSKEDQILLSQIISQRDPWLWLACQMMYYTALRPGEEIRLLKIGNINFSTKTITVNAKEAKNNTRETIDLPEALYIQLITVYQLKMYNQDYYIFGKYGIPGPIPLGINTMYNRFRTIRQELGISPECTFYSWKHTGAIALTTIDISPYDLQRHLRHKSLSTTEHYIRKRLGSNNKKIKHEFPDINT